MNSTSWFDGSAFREKRKAQGWTQQQAAELAGLSRGQIIAIEKGTFTGGLKYLRRYMNLVRLELQFRTKGFPQFEELREMFGEDDD